jgi:hypothetical protein
LHGPQVNRIRKALSKKFPPNGRAPANLTDKAVLLLLVPEFDKNGWKHPSIDSIARARGRRNKRG